jgi:alpha-L-rhamnosidase
MNKSFWTLKLLIWSYFLILLINPLELPGQSVRNVPAAKINPVLISDQWKASWITHPSVSVLDYGVFHFRKSFELSEKPDEFIIHVSADNRYRLYVNGTPVCFGPSRGDPGHWFYESIDIAQFLKPGSNLLAAVVWNAGEYKPWAQISLRTGFIVQGNGSNEEIVNTDGAWKVLKNNAYTPASATNRETSGQFVVVGPCDRVDGNFYPWNWEKTEFDDTNWVPASTIDEGHPYGVGTDIRWILTPRRIPLMELTRQRFASVRQALNCKILPGFLEGKTPLVIPPKQKVTILLDQGVLTTGYPELITSGGKGASIKLSYAESLFDSNGRKENRNDIEGKRFIGYADYFLPDGGINRLFRPLWFRTWRYLQIEINTDEKPLTINDLSSEFSAYPLVEKAVFDSDNTLLKQIWTTGWRTARLCANETYFDCPYYEQLQYIGDTRIQALISLYVSGDDRLVRNAIRQFDESRIPEGLTHSRYPTSLSQFIPPFSLFWIDMVHDYWMLRDDPDFVRRFLPGIGQVLQWYKNHIDSSTGMLGPVPYWNFVDWAKEWPWENNKRLGGVPHGGQEGGSSVLTMQLSYAAERASELFRSFRYNAEAEEYGDLSKSLSLAVYKNCWDNSTGYLADTPEKNQFSMHAQIFGVLTNTIPQDVQKSFTLKFMKDTTLIQPTMYFRAYLAQALKKTGLADYYIENLGLWEEMLSKGLTTFAENPDPARSDCHAWSASPNYDFLATVAGIRPGSPGFKTILIEPALGKLKWIKGRMPHPAGDIIFELKRKGTDGIAGNVILPDGLTGIFTWKGKTIKIEGSSIIDY